MQCNAMQCNAMQCNAMQCNAMQCNAMQCNAIKDKGNFFQRRVCAIKSVPNLKSVWRSSQNDIVLALFCSLHS